MPSGRWLGSTSEGSIPWLLVARRRQRPCPTTGLLEVVEGGGGWGEMETEEPEGESQEDITLCHLTTFYHILFVESKPLSASHTYGERN